LCFVLPRAVSAGDDQFVDDDEVEDALAYLRSSDGPAVEYGDHGDDLEIPVAPLRRGVTQAPAASAASVRGSSSPNDSASGSSSSSSVSGGYDSDGPRGSRGADERNGGRAKPRKVARRASRADTAAVSKKQQRKSRSRSSASSSSSDNEVELGRQSGTREESPPRRHAAESPVGGGASGESDQDLQSSGNPTAAQASRYSSAVAPTVRGRLSKRGGAPAGSPTTDSQDSSADEAPALQRAGATGSGRIVSRTVLDDDDEL
jgi:hypothetical protein